MTDIAHGDITIGLDQGGALADLARIQAEFRATMADINSMSAHAEVGAHTDKFNSEVDKAKAKLESIDRQEVRAVLTAKTEAIDTAVARVKAKLADLNRQKAEPHIGLNVKGLEAEIAKAELAITRLSARKAQVTVEVKEQRQMLDNLDKAAKFQERRNSVLRDTQRAMDSLAHAESRAALNTANHEVKIINLKKQYGELTDAAERLSKKTAYGREAKAKLDLASGKVFAEMEKIKAELQVLGDVPPVHIKVDTDGSRIDKMKIGFMDFVNKFREGIEGLGTTRINLGPISSSLRGMILGGSALAPIITSLGGGIVALAGSITTSLAGAAAVGGGLLMGLATNFLGVATAIKPTLVGFKEATAATTKYEQAVNKHGSASKQAAKAHEEMNAVLAHVPASSRQAAVALSAVKTEWKDLTRGTAQRDFGAVLKQGIGTLHTLLPGLAANTNKTMDIVRSRVDSVFAHLRKPQEMHAFDKLGADANKFLGPALSGLTRFGAGLLHIGESAAKIFAGPAGSAIQKWGQQFAQATTPGSKLDATITRIGNHAKDLLSFFGAFGRLAMTVLNGAANAGDHLTNSMTGALNRYNAFLKSERGQKDMQQFFSRSVDNVKALAGAFGPLISAFVQWSNLLAPFTSGLLQGVSFVSKLVASFTKLIGLGGPMAAFGATIGAAFAVSKIGTFVNLLIRAASLMKTLGAVGTIGKIASGGFGNLLKAENFIGSGVQVGESAAATMEGAAPGIGETIGAAAAAAMRIGAVEAGAVTAAETSAGAGVAGAAAGAAAGAGGTAAAAGGYSALASGEAAAATAGEGLATGLGAVGLGLASVGGLAVVLGLHFLKSKEHFKDFKETLKSLNPQLQTNEQNAEKLANATRGMDEANAEAGAGFHQSNITLKDLKHTLDSTAQGSRAHTEAELAYNAALRENNKLGAQWNRQKRETKEVSDKNVEGLKENLKALKDTEAIQKNNITNAKALGNKEAQQRDEKALLDLQNKRATTAGLLNEALDRQASVNARLARSYAGLPALTNAATESLGKLARTAGAAGQNIARTIATKYTSSVDVSNVAAQSRKALSTGIKQSVVLNVIANTSNAAAALRSLQNVSNITKHLDVIAHGGPAAVAMLSHIAGIHLTKKDVAILQHGGEGAINVVLKLIGSIGNLHPKSVSVGANVSGTDSVISLAGQIAQIHSTTATITVKTVHEESTLSTTGSGQVHGSTHRAEGGPYEPWEKTTGGVYNKPTLLVGEENRTEYVIATNPAYREANAEYLRMAAREFGYNIIEARKGKGKAAPTTAAQPKKAHLEPPADYAAAALPEAPIKEIAKALSGAVKSEHQKLDQLHISVHKAKEAYDKAKHLEGRAKPGKAKQSAHENTTRAREALHGYEHGVSVIEHGGGSYHGKRYERSLATLERESGIADKDTKLVEDANAKITHYNAVIQNDQTKLGNLATIFNGRGPNAGSASIKSQWDAVLSDRHTNITSVKALLEKSHKVASELYAKHPTADLQALLDQREGEIATAGTAQLETDEAQISPEANEGPPSAEKFVEQMGLKGTLAGLNEAFALAQTNNVSDNPNTPENEAIPLLSDDLKAAAGLKGFWETELSEALRLGAAPETITDIANAVTSARGTWEGIDKNISEGTQSAASQAYNEALAFGSARLDLYKTFGSNFAPTWTQPPPSIGGTAQFQPASTTTTHVNVVNNFSHPPLDPHSWSNSLSFELGAAI